MILWLLRPRDLSDNDNPWYPWYDKCFGYVIRAETEQAARKLAHENAGDENREGFLKTKEPWLDKKYSTCVELVNDGKSEIIIQDFSNA